eukprot:tig00021462_g21577.t1
MRAFVLEGRAAVRRLQPSEIAALQAAIHDQRIELRVVRDTHRSHLGYVSHLVLNLSPPEPALVRLVETRIAGARRFGWESWVLPRSSIPLVFHIFRDVPGASELMREASLIPEAETPCAFPDACITFRADSCIVSFDSFHPETSKVIEALPESNRRWDPVAAAWHVPIPALRTILSGLSSLGYTVPESLISLLSLYAPPLPLRAPFAPPVPESPRKRKGGASEGGDRSPGPSARRPRLSGDAPRGACSASPAPAPPSPSPFLAPPEPRGKRHPDSPLAPAKRGSGRCGPGLASVPASPSLVSPPWPSEGPDAMHLS